MPRSICRHWPAAAVFLAALAVYVITLCPTVFVEGAGENIVAAWTLGVPHPPGFPLFCLLGKLFATLFPLGCVASRINLFAAVMGGVAAVALYSLLITAGLRPLISASAALAFAFSSTFWRQATIAEVYTLSLTLILVQLLLLLRWRKALTQAHPSAQAPSRKRRGRAAEQPIPKPPFADRWLLWFALALGLGMTVHYSHALLLPAYLYFIAAHDRSVFLRGRTVCLAVLLALAGFGLHLYAPIRALARPELNWGDPSTLANWWRYLTAEQYRGRMFHLPPSKVLANLVTFARDLPHEFWWLGLAAALGGIIALARRDRRLLVFTVFIFLIAVVWAVNYDIPWEIDVYYLPATLMLAIWVAFGLQWLADRRLAPLALAVPALALLTNFGVNDLSRQRFVTDSGLDVLDSVEPKAVVILPATNPTFSLLYLTRVEGRSPSVELWSRLDRGLAPVETAVHPAVQLTPEPRFLSDRLAQGQAVFTVERVPAGSLPGIAQIPWGCVYRLVPANEEKAWLSRAPHLKLRFDPARQQYRYGAEQRLLGSRYLLVAGDTAWAQGDRARADECYQQALRVSEELAGTVLQVASRYTDQDRLDLAVALYERALAKEDDAEMRNRLGVIYGRRNQLAEAEEQFDRALSLKADFAEAHANLASVYGRQGKLEEAVSELELALKHDPANLLALQNLGYAYAQMGRREEARALLQRALEVSPAQPQVQQLLGELQ
jgi:Tfp pilus assembly protein PilF